MEYSNSEKDYFNIFIDFVERLNVVINLFMCFNCMDRFSVKLNLSLSVINNLIFHFSYILLKF